MGKTKKGTCLLCRLPNADLVKGHIIPSWADRVGGLKEQRLVQRLTSEYLLVNKPTGALQEHLFCNPCDSWIGKGEAELKHTFLPTETDAPNAKTPATIYVEDFPYFRVITPENRKKLIERAIAGIIFKAYLVRDKIDSQYYKKVELSPRRYKQFRDALLPGTSKTDNFDFLDVLFLKLYAFHHEINFIANGVLSMQTLREIPEVTLPGASKLAGVLYFAGLGILASYTKGNRKKSAYLVGRIVEIEDIGFPNNNYPNPFLLHSALVNPRSTPELLKSIASYNETDPCPCGLSKTVNKIKTRTSFKDCCKSIWFPKVVVEDLTISCKLSLPLSFQDSTTEKKVLVTNPSFLTEKYNNVSKARELEGRHNYLALR